MQKDKREGDPFGRRVFLMSIEEHGARGGRHTYTHNVHTTHYYGLDPRLYLFVSHSFFSLLIFFFLFFFFGLFILSFCFWNLIL